jgi:transcriptional regulator with XRE-family HTH domain
VSAEQPVSTAVENFADELRAWRERLGWSQAELGAGMGYSGSHVSSVETMSRTATYEFAKKADEALGTPGTFVRLHKQSEMELNEAKSMVQQRLSSIGDSEVEQLADALSSYPLAIRYACSFIANQPISVAQFCIDLQTELPRIVGKIETDDSAALLRVLLRMIDSVKKSDRLAFEPLMAMASSTAILVVYPSILARYASICNKGEPVSQTRFGEAIGVLKRFSFIDTMPLRTTICQHGLCMD